MSRATVGIGEMVARIGIASARYELYERLAHKALQKCTPKQVLALLKELKIEQYERNMLKMGENLSNKTCEGCKFFPGNSYYCPIIGRFCDPNNETTCEFFEKPVGRIATNGDVIRQGGDDALVAFKEKHKCDCCVYIGEGNCTEPVDRGNRCDDGLKHWLNAPANSVKQNGDHYTQTDLCRADYTESEVK